MALSDTTPGEILSLVTVAGNPYHGLVEAGTLTLPNAATMTHPQPGGGDQWFHGGRAMLLQRPGIIAPERDEGQITRDTANGHQWLNYALLSGHTSMLYGKPLGEGRWIYIDANGDRWLCRIVLTDGWAIGEHEGDTAHLRMARFGEFGVDAQVHDVAITIPNFGQDTPTGSFGASAGWRFDLIDTTPTGHRAVFMLYGFTVGYPALLVHHALAFAEIVISGLGGAATVTFSTVRNRAQCLGTVIHNDDYPDFANPDGLANDVSRQADPDYIPRKRWGLKFTSSVEDTGVGYPTCTGEVTYKRGLGTAYTITRWTDGNTVTWSPRAHEAADYTIGEYYEVAGTVRRQLSGAILSMYYKPDASLAEITVSQTVEHVLDLSAPNVVGKNDAVLRHQRTGVDGGSCSVSVIENTAGQAVIARSLEIMTTLDIVIASDGVTAFSGHYESANAVTETLTLNWDASVNTNEMAVSGTLVRQNSAGYTPGATSVTNINYNGSGNAEAAAPAWFAIPLEWPQVLDYWSTVRTPLFKLTQDGGTIYNDLGIPAGTTWRWIAPPAGNGRIAINIARLAPTIVGVCVTHKDVTIGTPMFTATWVGQIATAGTQTLTDIVVQSSDETPSVRLRASRHPVTGDVARSFNPICWV